MEITFTYTRKLDLLHVKTETNFEFDVRSWEVDKACKVLGLVILDEKEHTKSVSEKTWDNWMRGY